jgi:hypothetical protein
MGRVDMDKNNSVFEAATDNKSNFSNARCDISFGGICPACELGIFDYDGMLNLICPNCGYTAGGCFT